MQLLELIQKFTTLFVPQATVCILILTDVESMRDSSPNNVTTARNFVIKPLIAHSKVKENTHVVTALEITMDEVAHTSQTLKYTNVLTVVETTPRRPENARFLQKKWQAL